MVRRLAAVVDDGDRGKERRQNGGGCGGRGQGSNSGGGLVQRQCGYSRMLEIDHSERWLYRREVSAGKGKVGEKVTCERGM